METNVILFHVSEVQTITFRTNTKPERWDHLLNLVDDMTRIVVNGVLGEGVFNYYFSWRNNNDIVDSFIRCLARGKLDKWVIIKLFYNVINPIWCVGKEEVV